MSGVLELSSVVFVFIHIIISPEWLFDNECLCLSKALYTICVVKYLWRQNGIRLIIVFVWIQNKSHFKTLQCIYKMYTYFWCSQNIVHAYAFYLHTNLQHLKKSNVLHSHKRNAVKTRSLKNSCSLKWQNCVIVFSSFTGKIVYLKNGEKTNKLTMIGLLFLWYLILWYMYTVSLL